MTKKNKQALVPKLRFPEFQDASEWEQRKVGEIFEVTRGNVLAVSKTQPEKSEQYPYPVFSSQTKKDGLMGYYSSYLYENAITWTTDGANAGDTNYREGKFYCTNVCGVLLSDSGHANNCIANLINSVAKNYVSYVGNPKLMNGVMAQIEISLPTKLEQQKIADCLGSLDDLIAANSVKLDALQDHKKGLLQQLFPAEGQTTPSLRFPEFENTGEWDATTLCKACLMKAGKFVRAADINDDPQDSLFPCYGGNGLRGYTTTYTHEGKFSLIGRQGALCGNVQLATGCFHATEHAVVASPAKNVSSDWLYYALILLNLNRFATGQAQPGLSVEVLERVPVAIPTERAEQQRIADCLSDLDGLLTAQTEQVAALKKQKKGLMQQLFPNPELSKK